MPAYNSETTICEAIESILAQTYTDFELIIINDGSTDKTADIIKSFQDKRVKLLDNETNKGLIYSLNRGLDSADGEFIARMDADDISLPRRFEKQIACFHQNPDLVACGTMIEYFGNTELAPRKYITKTSDRENKELLLFTACFAHPTVMMRNEVLEKHKLRYDIKFKNCEDYKFWIDLMKYGEFCNVPEILLRYRQSDTQITHSGNPILKENSKKCRQIYIQKYYPEIKLNGQPTLESIRQLPKNKKYNQLKQLLYLSLPVYGMRAFFQFVFSGDFIKVSLHNNLAFMKRMLGKGEPLL